MDIKYQCPICDFDQYCKPLASMTEKYVAIKCRECQVVSAYPIPSLDELNEYYSSYQPTQETPERLSTLVELHEGILEYLVSKIGHRENLSFLDYGFGVGAFLKQVAQKGFHAYGAEFSKQNCEQLENFSRQNNTPIHTIQLSDTPLESLSGKNFDCITLFQVIEHIINPLELLSSLSSLQSSGGILYIECPNNDALYLKVKNAIREQVNRGDFFDSLNPPQHLYGFNRHSMQVLLEKAGYIPLEISDYFYADGLHQVETLLWYPSFQNLLQNRSAWNFYGVSKSLIGFFEPLASKFLGAGGGLYAVARKK